VNDVNENEDAKIAIHAINNSANASAPPLFQSPSLSYSPK